MSWMEITLIVAAVAVPIVTLFMVLPKKKKEAKEEKPAEKPAEKAKDNAVADKPAEKIEPVVASEPKDDAKTIRPVFDSIDYKAEDFRDYLKEKSKTTSRPKRKVMGNDFKDLSTGWENFMKTPVPPKKTLADDICCLAPEVQAMIFAGLLDRKY